MAIWTFVLGTWTPAAVADASNFTDAGHQTIQGGSSTQRVKIKEVFMGGQAASTSSPTFMLLARDSIVGATPTALASPNSAAPVDPSTAALAAPVVCFVASTTKPQRSNSTTVSKLANLSFNAYGGLVRKEWAEGQEPQLLGNTASLGEISLSAFSGGTPGAMGSHIVFEPL